MFYKLKKLLRAFFGITETINYFSLHSNPYDFIFLIESFKLIFIISLSFKSCSFIESPIRVNVSESALEQSISKVSTTSLFFYCMSNCISNLCIFHSFF